MEKGKWKEGFEKIEEIIKEEKEKRVTLEEDSEFMKLCWGESERREIGRSQVWKTMKEEKQILKGQSQEVMNELRKGKKEREKLERKLEEIGGREERDGGKQKRERQGILVTGTKENKEEETGEVAASTSKKEEEIKKKVEKEEEKRAKDKKEKEEREEKTNRTCIIVEKGSRWGEKGTLRNWISEEIGNEKWIIEPAQVNENKWKVIFEEGSYRNKIWKNGGRWWKGRIVYMDTWLSWQERINRCVLLKEAEEFGRKGLKVKKEDRKLIIGKDEYVWDEKRRKLKKVETTEEEEEREESSEEEELKEERREKQREKANRENKVRREGGRRRKVR